MGSTGFSFGCLSSPSYTSSFFSNSSSTTTSSSSVPLFTSPAITTSPSFGQRTPTTTTQAPSFSFSVGGTATAPYLFSTRVNNNTTTTTAPSSLPQASVQSKSDAEQSKAEIPSIEQTKPVGKFQSVKQEIQLKASETNGTDVVTELLKESGSDSPNNGLKFYLGELSIGEGIVDAKDKSIGSRKSERFGHTRILRGISQNPHYTPLQCYSKRAREKLIVGWDEIFEETIDQIQSLTTETFSSNVSELWKTMAELENLGYNVARLKKRMEDLTDVINRRKTSQTEISDLRAKAEDYKEQKKKIEKEITDLQVQADNAQVMVNELMDQIDKMEGNLPVVDALFESVAVKPL